LTNRVVRFFAAGDDEGRWTAAQRRIRELIELEDRRRPLDDTTISAVLRDEGVEVPRRAVTKLRKQLGIASSRQRRAV
jgi:RNA polymerase sigma-54 factor